MYNFKFRTLLALIDHDCRVTKTNPRHVIYNRRQTGNKSATNWPSSWKFCVDILLQCDIKLTPCARVARNYTRISLPNHLQRCRWIIKKAISDSCEVSRTTDHARHTSQFRVNAEKIWMRELFFRKDRQHIYSRASDYLNLIQPCYWKLSTSFLDLIITTLDKLWKNHIPVFLILCHSCTPLK